MVTDFYHPLLGGVEQHVRTLSHELCALGHRVTVATLRTGDSDERERDGEVDIVRVRSSTQRLPKLFDQVRPWAPPVPDPSAARALRRLIDDIEPDVLHGHDWLAQSLLPLRRNSPPLVTSLHYYTRTCAKKDLLYRSAPCSGPAVVKCLGCARDHYGAVKGTVTATALRVGRRMADRACAHFIAVSTATAIGNGLTVDDGTADTPCAIIPNFLPTDELDDRDRAIAAPFLARLPDDDFFAYVGDFRATKGFDVLLEAYDRLNTERPLVVIGKRWPTTPVTMPHGVIVGEQWPNVAVRAMYARARAAIVPSVWAEPFGIVAIEAMEQGTPVIASAHGGLTDIVDDERTGLLVEPGSSEALAAAMRSIDTDDELAARLGAAARRAAQEYRADRVVPRIVDVYRQVTQASSR